MPLLATACGGSAAHVDAGVDASSRECETFFGDRDAGVEVLAGARSAGGDFVSLSDGDAVDLIFPPQGGHCLFAAARVRNLCADDVRLTARLLDAGGALRSGPFRVGPPLVPDPQDESWSIPDMAVNTANVPNVCACPNGFGDPLAGAHMILRVEIDDLVEGREGVNDVIVVPSCRQDATECRELCECQCGPGPVELGSCPAPGPDSGVRCDTTLGSSDGFLADGG